MAALSSATTARARGALGGSGAFRAVGQERPDLGDLAEFGGHAGRCEGLADEPRGAGFGRPVFEIRVGVAGDHDHGDIGVGGAQEFEKLDAVAVGQVVVEAHDVRAQALHGLVQALAPGQVADHVVALVGEQRTQDRA